MIITCEACNASFNLDESRIAPSGSKVRCSKCKKVFIAYPSAPPSDEALHGKGNAISDTGKTDDLEFGLDFEMESREKEDVGDALGSEVSEELDLSDLELELDLDQERDVGEIEEFKELELELEELDEIEEAGAAGMDETSDLKLELDDLDELGVLGREAQSTSGETAGNEDENDFDLGEFDLELDNAGGEDEAEETETEALEFEELNQDKMPGDEEISLAEPVLDELEADELDLGDFDLELDKAQQEKVDEIEIEEESDIILGEESEEELTESEAETIDFDSPQELENEEELTFEGLDDSDIAARAMATPKTDLFEVEEISLEDDSFSMGEDKQVAETGEPGASKPFSTGGGVKVRTVSPASEPVKKGANLFLVGILIVVLLLGGTYFVLDYLGIEIPYISELKAPVKNLDRQGNIKITLLDYNGNFINNVHAGKLYIIRGQARNDYAESRGFIQITGSLYSRAKMLIKKETVYCGNILSDLDLTNLQLDAIEKRLQNRVGDNGSNIRLAPGKKLPFMVVFSNLPDSLEEFRLDIVGSMKVQ